MLLDVVYKKARQEYLKTFFCIISLFISLQTYSQVIVNVTIINRDSELLEILAKKTAYNSAILASQTFIYEGLKEIKKSKIETRIKEYEKNDYDKSLKIPIASNFAINNILLGTAIGARSTLPFYNTIEKNEYFTRELAINNSITSLIAISRNSNIRNANTQELYSLNQKMLSKLKYTNENAQRNALFIILASLLAKTRTMPLSDLNDILSLGL